jgi:ABC-type multidrug transport system ATPase subunit
MSPPRGLIRFRKKFWDMLKTIATRGITILVSTYMDEAALCDRIALIQKEPF